MKIIIKETLVRENISYASSDYNGDGNYKLKTTSDGIDWLVCVSGNIVNLVQFPIFGIEEDLAELSVEKTSYPNSEDFLIKLVAVSQKPELAEKLLINEKSK